MPEQQRILIGFADALAAPESAWSLMDAGFAVSAFSRPGRRSALTKCRGVELLEVTPPAEDAWAAVNDVNALVASGAFDALLALDDDAVWVIQQTISNPGVKSIGPPSHVVGLALDKGQQLALARQVGFLCPPTQIIQRATDLRGHAGFPLVLKSAVAVELVGKGLRRGPTSICAGSDELAAALDRWDENAPLLVQPLLHGTGEGLFGLAAPGGVTAFSAHQRIRMMNPAGSGSSACTTRPVDMALMEPAEAFIRSAQWQGPFMIELLRDEAGTVWFLELNGRLWGSLALARRAGLEYPAWAARTTFDPSFAPTPRPVPDGLVCRHLGRELVHLLIVLRGPRSAALVDRWPSRWSTLHDVLRIRRTDRWYNYRRANPAVLVADTIDTFRNLRGSGRGRKHEQ